jgi:hypothetical protein
MNIHSWLPRNQYMINANEAKRTYQSTTSHRRIEIRSLSHVTQQTGPSRSMTFEPHLTINRL